MSEQIIKELMEKQKELVKKSEKMGYAQGLSDLLNEIQLKDLDGFIVNREMVEELVLILLEKKGK